MALCSLAKALMTVKILVPVEGSLEFIEIMQLLSFKGKAIQCFTVKPKTG
jgi:hypothetical protein